MTSCYLIYFIIFSSTNEGSSKKEKQIYTTDDCHLVTLMDVVAGKFEISTTHVYFYQNNENTEGKIILIYFLFLIDITTI